MDNSKANYVTCAVPGISLELPAILQTHKHHDPRQRLAAG